ncbi:MAG: hypothetical protein RLW62_04015, partial [Gammaproteobacteria bacterium]
ALRSACMEPFEAALRRGVASGELRSCDIAETLRFVFQLLDVTHWYRPDGTKRATDFARDACALLLDGLCSDATRSMQRDGAADVRINEQ